MNIAASMCLLIGVAALALTGCNRSDRESAIIGFGPPMSYSGGPRAKAGSEQGTIGICINLRPTNVIFVVWSGEGGGGSFRLRNIPAHTPGTLLRDHEIEAVLGEVPISFKTTDEKYGPLLIGEEPFDLAKGGLFLVVNRASKRVVKQMDLAKLKLEPTGANKPADLDNDFFRKLAEADADIRSFWTGDVSVESNQR